jgi:hypothetical protein
LEIIWQYLELGYRIDCFLLWVIEELSNWLGPSWFNIRERKRSLGVMCSAKNSTAISTLRENGLPGSTTSDIVTKCHADTYP